MSTRKDARRDRHAQQPSPEPNARHFAGEFSPLPAGASRFNVFSQISSADDEWVPEWPEPWWKEKGDTPFLGWGDHFIYAGNQINTDLAAAAACEQSLQTEFGSKEFGNGELNGYDLFRSPMYWKLRQSFVDHATAGDPYAFADAIWRAYRAGRLCPERLLLPEVPPVRLQAKKATNDAERPE